MQYYADVVLSSLVLVVRSAQVFDLGFDLCKDLNSHPTQAEDRR
jgi:hypothetical protein